MEDSEPFIPYSTKEIGGQQDEVELESVSDEAESVLPQPHKDGALTVNEASSFDDQDKKMK